MAAPRREASFRRRPFVLVFMPTLPPALRRAYLPNMGILIRELYHAGGPDVKYFVYVYVESSGICGCPIRAAARFRYSLFLPSGAVFLPAARAAAGAAAPALSQPADGQEQDQGQEDKNEDIPKIHALTLQRESGPPAPPGRRPRPPRIATPPPPGTSGGPAPCGWRPRRLRRGYRAGRTPAGSRR